MDDFNSISLFVEKQQLHINCLSDSDRNIRTRGLDTITKNIFPEKTATTPQNYIDHLAPRLMSPLLRLFEDKIEKIRQLSIELVNRLLTNYTFEEKSINVVISSLIARLNHVPFPETSEELRQNLIKLLFLVLQKFRNDLLAQVADLSAMLGKVLTDACPEVKIKASELLVDLSKSLGKALGPHSKSIVVSICGNLKHSHNKIRKISLLALSEVLLCENAGKFFEDCSSILKVVSNDKNYDVRKTFYACVFRLLTNFNIVYLRKYEHLLVMLLMNGLSDEKEDIQSEAADYIEQAGEYRMKLAEEMEEEIDSNLFDGQIELNNENNMLVDENI